LPLTLDWIPHCAQQIAKFYHLLYDLADPIVTDDVSDVSGSSGKKFTAVESDRDSQSGTDELVAHASGVAPDILKP